MMRPTRLLRRGKVGLEIQRQIQGLETESQRVQLNPNLQGLKMEQFLVRQFQGYIAKQQVLKRIQSQTCKQSD